MEILLPWKLNSWPDPHLLPAKCCRCSQKSICRCWRDLLKTCSTMVGWTMEALLLRLTGTWEKVRNLPWLTFHWLELVDRVDITHLDCNKISLHSNICLLAISEALVQQLSTEIDSKMKEVPSLRFPTQILTLQIGYKEQVNGSSDQPLQIESVTVHRPTSLSE